jgi:hypothetical protein
VGLRAWRIKCLLLFADHGSKMNKEKEEELKVRLEYIDLLIIKSETFADLDYGSRLQNYALIAEKAKLLKELKDLK